MFAAATTTGSEPREEDLHSRPTSTLPVPLPSSSSSSSNNNNNNSGGILFTGGSRSGMYLSVNHQRRPDDRLIFSWCTSSPRLLVPYPHDPSTMKFEDHPTQDMLDDYVTEMLSKAFASASLRTLLSVRRLANTTPLPVFVELVDATTTTTTTTTTTATADGQVESGDHSHEYSYMHVALFLSTLKALQPALASSRNAAIRINFMGCTFRNCNLTDRDVATFLNGLNGTLDMWSSSLMNKNNNNNNASTSSTSSTFTIGCWPVHALDGSIPTTIEFSFCENPNVSATSFPQLIKGVAHFVSTLAPPEAHVKRALHLVMFFTSVKNAFSQENNSNNNHHPKTKCVQVAKATSDLWCQKTGLCIDVNFLSDDPYSFSLDRDGSVGAGSVGNNYAASLHAGSCDRSYSCLSYMSGGSVIDERIFSDPSVILAAKKQKVMLLQQQEQQHKQQQQKEKEENVKHYENINNNNDDDEHDCDEDSRTASPMPIAPALPSSSSKTANNNNNMNNKNSKTNNNIFPKPAPPKTSTPIRGSAPIPPQSSIQLVQQKQQNNNNNNHHQQTRDDYDDGKTQKNDNDDQKFSASISFFSLYELLSRNMNIYIQEASERAQLVSKWCQEVTKYFEFDNDNHNFGMTPEIKESLLLHHNLLNSLRYNIFSHNNTNNVTSALSLEINNPIPLLRCEDFDDVILPLLSQCAASVIQNHAIVRPNHLRQVMQNIRQFLVKDKWCGWNSSLVESNNTSNLNNIVSSNINLSEICSEVFSLWSQTGGNPSVVVDRAFDAAEKILVEVDPWLKIVDSKMMKLLQESYGLVEVHFAFIHSKMLLIAKEEKTRKMKLLKEQQQQQQRQQAAEEEENKKREAEDLELLRQRRQQDEGQKRGQRKEIESNINSKKAVKIKEPKQQLHREHTVDYDDEDEIKPRSYAKKSVSIEQQPQPQHNNHGREVENNNNNNHDHHHQTEYYPPQKIPHREYKQAKPLPPWGSAFAAATPSSSSAPNNSNSRSSSANHQHQQDENSQPRKKRELTKPSVREIMEQYTKANEEAEIKRRQQKKQNNTNNSSVSQSNSRSSSAVSNFSNNNHVEISTTTKPDWIEVNSNCGRVPTLREKDEKSKKEDAARQELERRQQEYMEDRRRKSEQVKQRMTIVNESNNIHHDDSFSSSPVPQKQQNPSSFHSTKNDEKSRAPSQLQGLRDGWKKPANHVASPPLEKNPHEDNVEKDEEETETSCIVHHNNNDNFSSPCDLYERSPIPNVPSAKKSKDVKNNSKSNNEKTLSSIESLLSQALISAAKNDPNLIDSAVSPRRLLKALLKATNGEKNSKKEPSVETQLRLDSSSPIHHRHPSIANVVNGLVWNASNNQNGVVDNNYYFTPPRFTPRQQLLPQSSFHYHHSNNHHYSQPSSNSIIHQNKPLHQFGEAENDNALSFAQQFELMKKMRENNISGESDVPCSPLVHDNKISQPSSSSGNYNKSSINMSRPLTNLQNFTNRDRIIYQQQKSSSNNQKNIPSSGTSSVWDSMFQNIVDTENNHQLQHQHPSKLIQSGSGTFLHQHFSGQASYGDTTNEMLKKIRNFGTNAERQHNAPEQREKRFDPFLGTAQRQQDEELERDSLQLHNEILEHLQRVTPGLKEEAEKRARALFSGI